MAVAYDATGAGNSANATSTSWAHTLASGAVILTAVALGGYFSGDTPASWTRSVTCGSTAMTSLGTMQGNNTGGYPFVELWGLLTPTSGAQTITANYSGGGGTPYLCANSVSYTGVGSFGTAVTNYSNSNALSSGAVASATGNMVVSAQQLWGNTGTYTLSSPSGTSRYNFAGTVNTYPSLLVQDVSAAATNTLTSTGSGSAFWGTISVNLKVPVIITPSPFFAMF